MIVEVESIGKIEFPDNTSPDIVQSTVKRLVGGSQQSKDTGLFSQFSRIKDIYLKEVSEGEGSMKKAVEEPTGRNIISGFLGALQYTFSPLTAVAKGAVGEPVSEGLQSAGVSPEVSNFVGALGETAVGFVPYGKAVNLAIKGKEALEAGKMAGKAVGGIEKVVAKGKKPLEFAKGTSDEVIAATTKPISETQKAVLREDVVGDVINAVKQPVSEKWVPAGEKRITQEVVDYIMANKEEIPKALHKYNLTAEELAAQIKETMSTSGRQLGQMGRWAKEIMRDLQSPEMRQLASYMEKNLPEPSTIDKVMDVFKGIENKRRGLLVSQVVTTMRNVISQGARLTIGSVDDAFQGAVKGFMRGEGAIDTTVSTLRGLGEGLDAWTATINRVRPAARENLRKILDTDQALQAKSVMFSTPVHEVTLGDKLTKVLGYPNKMQEYFFRNIAFEAKLNQLLKDGGMAGGLKGVAHKDIPEAMLTQAAKHALEMTFSAMPKSNFGREWVKSMTNPVFTSLLNPFPRFLFGNALPFLKNFSPIGFLEAVKPSVIADLAAGNPEKFAKAASQATIGTIMLNTAAYIRSNPEIGGEKWYEVKTGKDRRLDLRAFAPLSTYLFIAESMMNPEKIKPADFASAMLSLNRIAGTGLVMTDILRGKDADTVKTALTRLGGEYLGSFTTSARTIKDIYSALDPDEAVIRDVRERELVGPTMRNIPGVSQKLPEARSPLKPGPMKTEQPVFRQFTGLSTRTKTLIEKEVQNINLDSSAIYPRTGVPEGDRKVSEIMAPMIEQTAPILINRTGYNRLDEISKRLIMKKYFSDVKEAARLQLLQQDPKLALKIKIDRISDDEMKLLKKAGVLR